MLCARVVGRQRTRRLARGAAIGGGAGGSRVAICLARISAGGDTAHSAAGRCPRVRGRRSVYFRNSENRGRGLVVGGGHQDLRLADFFHYINGNVAAFAVVAVLLLRRAPSQKQLLVFSAVVALGFLALLAAQVRWSFGASGPLLCLLLVVVAALVQGRSSRVRALVVLAVGAPVFCRLQSTGSRPSEGAWPSARPIRAISNS